MNKPLSLYIALKFSRRKRQQVKRSMMISFTSIISILSIALGVATLIVSLSVMNGFEYELNQRILSIIPHGEIEPVNLPFKDWEKILNRIKQVPGIISAEPYINFTGFIKHNNILHPIQIKGIDIKKKIQPSFFLFSIEKNNILQKFQNKEKCIILGKKITENLDIKIGDWITVIISIKNMQKKISKLKKLYLQVAGVIILNSQMENNISIIPIEDAQFYLNKDNYINGIAIKVTNIFHADQLVYNAGKATNTNVYTRSWIDTYGYIHRDIQIIRTIIYLAVLLIVIIICFNIISMLILSVKDKSVSIAIMRTLGAQNSIIYSIFIWYGLLVNFTGGIIGIIIGVIITQNLTFLSQIIEKIIGQKILPDDIYFINFLPAKLYWWDVINTTIIILTLSLVATWYPARKACRINPVKILK